MRRDFWDWVVVVGVPVGAIFAALSVLVGWIALRRGRRPITFRDAQCETVEGHPDQVDASVFLKVSAIGRWERRALEATVRSGRWRRKSEGR